jgi:hypothetical protein
LSEDEARALVASQLAFDFRAHTPYELIEQCIARPWGWLFVYPAFGGGPPNGYLVHRTRWREMRHVSTITSVEETIAAYERGLASE